MSTLTRVGGHHGAQFCQQFLALVKVAIQAGLAAPMGVTIANLYAHAEVATYWLVTVVNLKVYTGFT
jgi:hypothetical protein